MDVRTQKVRLEWGITRWLVFVLLFSFCPNVSFCYGNKRWKALNINTKSQVIVFFVRPRKIWDDICQNYCVLATRRTFCEESFTPFALLDPFWTRQKPLESCRRELSNGFGLVKNGYNACENYDRSFPEGFLVLHTIILAGRPTFFAFAQSFCGRTKKTITWVLVQTYF